MLHCGHYKISTSDTLDKGRSEDILKRAVRLGKMQRKIDMGKASRPEVRALQAARVTDKTKLETKPKRMKISELGNNFPELCQQLEFFAEICLVKLLVAISVIWYADGEHVMYNGEIEEMTSKTKYEVAYWCQGEHYKMTTWALAADLISTM